MTPQEAIEILERNKDFQFGDKKYGGGITVPEIIELLKKQVPQLPTMKLSDFYYYIFCPNCNAYLGGKERGQNYYGSRPQYCQCGQELDWSEVDMG